MPARLPFVADDLTERGDELPAQLVNQPGGIELFVRGRDGRSGGDPRAHPGEHRCRVAGRGEAAPLDDVLAGLSPRSRYLRFHSPIPALTAAMRRVLLEVDGRDHAA